MHTRSVSKQTVFATQPFHLCFLVCRIIKMVLSMERWKGKVAVVTGASEGIGAAIVKALVKEGLTVVGFARRKEKILEIPVNDPSRLHALKVDITKEEDIVSAFKWIKENLGPVHILINNAGIFPNSNLSDGATESWKRTFDTNVLGLCIATREALKNMDENGIAGHIIHINSMQGHRVIYIDGSSVYAPSKYAVTALTETLRQELNAKGSKTKVTSVSPGYVKSSFLPNAGIKSAETAIKAIVANAVGLEPEDIADAVVYALSTPPHVQVHEMMVQPMQNY